MPNAFRITSTSAEPVEIPLSLASFQHEVGGYIEAAFTVPSPDGGNRYVTGYVNEEGLLMGLDICMMLKSGQPLAGPCIITGLDYSTGETVPLSENEIRWVQNGCHKVISVIYEDRKPENIYQVVVA